MNTFMNSLLTVAVAGIAVCSFISIYILVHGIKRTFLKYERFPAVVPVVDKEYKPAYIGTALVKNGKANVPQRINRPEEYNVFVEYRGERYTISNKELYEKINVGESIMIMVNVGTNEKGVEKDFYVEL